MAIRDTGVKKKYNFEIRRRFDYTKRYKTLKKPPLEKLKEDISKFFQKKKKPKTITEEKKPKKGGRQFNTLLVGVAVTVAILLIVAGYAFISLQQAKEGYQPGPIVAPEIETLILGSGVIGSADRTTNDNVAYVTMDYFTAGLMNNSIKLSVYSDPIPSEVFLLSSDRYDADGYPQFSKTLKTILERKGISVNEIDLQLIETIPRGAIIIIPTGYMPKELLGVDSTVTLNDLIEREVVVIYIGFPFNKMLDEGIPVVTPSDVLTNTGIRFDETVILTSTDGFGLFQPLYRAEGTGVSNKMIYGSVSSLKKGGGAILFLPQTLDGGWRGEPNNAAKDVARIIYETPWTNTVTEPKYYIGEDGQDIITMFTNKFSGTKKSIKIEFEGYDDDDNKIERYRIVNVDKDTKGDLYISGGSSVVPTDITESPIFIDARLDEDNPVVKTLYFVIENGTDEVGERVDLGQISTQAQIPKDISIHINTGEYIAAITDDVSTKYAECYMKVVSVEPVQSGLPVGNVYTFKILQDGLPKEVGKIVVSVDDGKYGVYEFTDTAEIQIDLSSNTGGVGLPAGDHIFTFRIGKLDWDVTVVKRAPDNPFTNPVFIGSILISVIVVGLGIYFASKETTLFQLDIPDFPPIARTRIPLLKVAVLNIFEKVNSNYKWNEVPLTVSEIKSGFRNLDYKGQPIYISDYNVEYLMDKLKASGDVKEALGYYGLTSWEKRSERTMRYIALFRKIRDICVNNAVPFTRKGEAKGCDTEITVMGQEMHVHLYDRHGNVKQLVRNALETVKKGITVIAFESERDKRDFENLLRSPSKAMLLLKMEQNTGSILLLQINDFDKMIKDIKEV